MDKTKSEWSDKASLWHPAGPRGAAAGVPGIGFAYGFTRFWYFPGPMGRGYFSCMDVQLKRGTGLPGGGYRYGASQRAASPPRAVSRLRNAADAKGTTHDGGRFRSLLSRQRPRLARADSSFRALIARRNELIAQCVQDRLPVTRIAAALGVSAWVVRTAAGDAAGLPPSGISRQSRLGQLEGIAGELAEADAERLGYEAERQALVADAHRDGVLDVFELASLTGLTPEHIRKMTRGTRKAS